MEQRNIHAGWTMHAEGKEERIAASVPGSVYHDLLQAGKMEDPYYRDNELKALKIMEQDFVYETLFEADEKIRKEEVQLLRFEGIDTLADIYLNEAHLAYVNNMHRIWEFLVNGLLKKGENSLQVVFHSPTRYIREMYEKNHVEGTSDAMRGFPSIRKAHCMFGWDWGPRLPDVGLWREVKLLAYSDARIDSVYFTQVHEKEQVTLLADLKLELAGKSSEKAENLEWRIRITDPDGETSVYQKPAGVQEENSQIKILIQNPKLWWPNGYGDQPLYQVQTELLKNGQVIDTDTKRIGLRTMTVRREKDAFGESFAHEVNGVPIFAMGGDYIPEDNILARVTPERTRNLLIQAKRAHFNCIRVWGGGYYPSDFFWDICDELGLIVWEDFMFACAGYDLTEEFEENIIAEFKDNIRRIRHHASLGLWCGNNEMEMFTEAGLWIDRPRLKSDYVKMYEYILPKVVKKYDPNTFYWPASPSSGGAFDEPNSENRGDVHYWDVWHGNKPITEFRKFYFRYLSEFGFQSFPLLKTCESFTRPEDRNIFSYVMEKHQRNQAANGKIMNYMEQTYLYPTGFSLALYASQLLQAQAVRYGVEHFRRNRGRCMGTIIWQLNDCWPVASWSAIDYYGRWKALHYYTRRFFAPLLLSCEEEGILSQDTNPNAEPYEVKKSVRFNVSNESRKQRTVTVEWELKSVDWTVKRQESMVVQVEELSAKWMEKVELPEADLYSDYVIYRLKENGEILSESTVIFCQPKYFAYPDPKLCCHVEGDTIVVEAKAYAHDVEILNENEDLILQDNYFDMEAGEKRIKIIEGRPEGLRVRSVYDIR